MKYLVTLVLLLHFYAPGSGQTAKSVNKKALLIGVGTYTEGSRWRSLSSVNDIRYLREALMLQKFPKENITVLTDSQATKDSILAALKELAKNAKEDEVIFFHFSGHGQQIQDDDAATREETDGYDEALIPFDVIEGNYSNYYKGEKHLRDDELEPILNEIRQKIGPNGSLVVSLDACHSGTATRSAQFTVTRGEAIPFKNPKYVPPYVKVLGDGFADAGKNAANMIVLSASSPHQVNYETKDREDKGVGSLSYALAKALSELPENSNYNILFNRVKSEIQGNFPGQIPMMEGNGNQKIFSGDYVDYDEIVEVRWLNDDSTITIPAGYLHGINKNTVIELYMSGKPEKLMEARPIQIGNFETLAQTRKMTGNKTGYHAKWESGFGNFEADIFFKTTMNSKSAQPLQNQLQTFISRQPYLTMKSSADFMLEIYDSFPEKGIDITLLEKGDGVRWTYSLPAGDTLTDKLKEQLLESIRNTIKVKFLREMRDGGALTQEVKVEIVPAMPTIENQQIVVKASDKFDIVVTNKSSNDLFFTIINLTPDNQAKVLVPEAQETPQEFMVKAGKSYTVQGFYVDENPAPGAELFKVVFSKTPMDLRKVFNTTRDRGPGEMLSFENALEGIIENSKGISTTRSGRSNVKLGEVGILTASFTVRPVNK